MRAFAIVSFGLAASMPCLAGDIAGRWQGEAHVPGRPLAITVDLARNASGAWTGSLIIPELGVKGAALTDISEESGRVVFATQGSGDSGDGKIAFRGTMPSGETMDGDFSVGGNATKFELRKTGVASVDLPPASTPLDKAFEGKWVGDYVVADVPRHVTMIFANNAGGAATAKFVVVGKKTTDVTVDVVRQDAAFVVVRSNAYQIDYEGRLHNGEITGTFTQGPYELPLNLHREP